MPGPGRADAVLATAAALGLQPRLPFRRQLGELIAGAREALRADPAELRPRDAEGEPGGLLLLPALPTLLVPDIHARPELLRQVLAWEGPAAAPFGMPLARLLEAGRATLVCLGDIFHSEWAGAPSRWRRSFREYLTDWSTHQAMDEEMALALSAVRIVLEAKIAFRGSFHYLKGNHDNITNGDDHGDRGFYKFAAEGEMVSSWFELAYGSELHEAFRALELDYPLLAVGDRFAASHGEPAFALDRDDVVEYRHRPDVVYSLIWTPNDGAAAGSVEEGLRRLLAERPAGSPASEGALWFGGHRPIEGRYALRANGRYVQFHDPSQHQVALLMPGRAPDPDRDIHRLSVK